MLDSEFVCLLNYLCYRHSVCMYVDHYTKHNVNLKQCTVYCWFRWCFLVHLRMLFQGQKLYSKQCWNRQCAEIVFDTIFNVQQTEKIWYQYSHITSLQTDIKKSRWCLKLRHTVEKYGTNKFPKHNNTSNKLS